MRASRPPLGSPPLDPPTPRPPGALSQNFKNGEREDGGSRERGSRGKTPRGGTKNGATNAQRRLIVNYWLKCPNCFQPRREWFYASALPSYLTCAECLRVIPTGAWLVRAFSNLGQPPSEVRDDSKICVQELRK